MAKSENMIGIDNGSAALNVLDIDPAGQLIKSFYGFHHGHAGDHLKRALARSNTGKKNRTHGGHYATHTALNWKLRFSNMLLSLA